MTLAVSTTHATKQHSSLLIKCQSDMLESCSEVLLMAFYCIFKPQLSKNSPRKKGSLGRLTFLLEAHSWKAAVLSLTHCHEPASVCHTVVVKLWDFDESSVSACWYRVYDTILSPCAICWHFSAKLSKHFRDRAKLSASSDGWQKDAAAWNGGTRFLDVCDTVQSWSLFVGVPSKTAEFRCAEECLAERRFIYLLEVVLKWGRNGNLTFW